METHYECVGFWKQNFIEHEQAWLFFMRNGLYPQAEHSANNMLYIQERLTQIADL